MLRLNPNGCQVGLFNLGCYSRSRWVAAPFGVPQAQVLKPLIYILYMFDVSSLLCFYCAFQSAVYMLMVYKLVSVDVYLWAFIIVTFQLLFMVWSCEAGTTNSASCMLFHPLSLSFFHSLSLAVSLALSDLLVVFKICLRLICTMFYVLIGSLPHRFERPQEESVWVI